MRLRHWFLVLFPGALLCAPALAEPLLPISPAEVVAESEAADSPVDATISINPDDQSELVELNSNYPAIAECSRACAVCPDWTIQAGIIALRRDNQNPQALTNGATPITMDRLALRNYQAGPLVTVIRHGVLNTAWDLDLTYFGVNDFHTTASSTGVTTILSNPTINSGPLTVTSDYRSHINSTELNLRRNWNSRFTAIAGIRWVEISDVLSTDIGGAATYDVNVNNHLYGFQIGGQAQLLRRGRFSLDAVGKAGVYNNHADQLTTTTGVGGAVASLSASGINTAFVGDLGVTAAYAINDRWTLRGGYQAIWVNGIALAPDQLDDSDIATGAATLDTSGHPIYHGLTLAAELAW